MKTAITHEMVEAVERTKIRNQTFYIAVSHNLAPICCGGKQRFGIKICKCGWAVYVAAI